MSLVWIATGPLQPWMYQYLQWLANEPTGRLAERGAHRGNLGSHTVTMAQKTARARFFSKHRLSDEAVRTLETRADAVVYFDKLRSDAVYKAKEMMSLQIGSDIEARQEALRVARGITVDEAGNQTQDLTKYQGEEVRHLTNYVTEVAFPKKGPDEGKVTKVTINIGSLEQAKQLMKAMEDPDDIPEIDYEVVERKQLTDGDDDGEG